MHDIMDVHDAFFGLQKANSIVGEMLSHLKETPPVENLEKVPYALKQSEPGLVQRLDSLMKEFTRVKSESNAKSERISQLEALTSTLKKHCGALEIGKKEMELLLNNAKRNENAAESRYRCLDTAFKELERRNRSTKEERDGYKRRREESGEKLLVYSGEVENLLQRITELSNELQKKLNQSKCCCTEFKLELEETQSGKDAKEKELVQYKTSYKQLESQHNKLTENYQIMINKDRQTRDKIETLKLQILELDQQPRNDVLQVKKEHECLRKSPDFTVDIIDSGLELGASLFVGTTNGTTRDVQTLSVSDKIPKLSPATPKANQKMQIHKDGAREFIPPQRKRTRMVARKRFRTLRQCEETKTFIGVSSTEEDETLLSACKEHYKARTTLSSQNTGEVILQNMDQHDDGTDTRCHGRSAFGGFDGPGTELGSSVSLTDEDEIDSELDNTFGNKFKGARRKKCFKGWDFEADILDCLQRDDELCMKAVCALYRQQKSDEKAGKASLYYNHRGFNGFDILRGSAVAEFLTDGNPLGPIVKSASDVQSYRPEWVEYSRELAIRYSRQLFEIYTKKEDPFFLPS